MNILAIDQSTRSSGWCILSDGMLLEYGVVKTPSGKQGLEAALWQCQQLAGIAAQNNIQALAIEDIFVPSLKAQNAKTIVLLGCLKGMLVITADRYNWQWVTVTSPEVCQHLGLKVNTPREQKKRASRQIAAMELFGDRTRYEEIPEDVADAIAIGGIAMRKLLISERTVL